MGNLPVALLHTTGREQSATLWLRFAALAAMAIMGRVAT
jgi:hypothetical protein